MQKSAKTDTLFNSSITIEEFLSEYWNKKPLLIRSALKGAQDLAGPQDLLELALDEDFETRMVFKDKEGKRKMTHGPFEQSELSKLSKRDFALICHNLNALAPEFYELEQMADFAPKWEFDDVMSVYSNKAMSLGAHIDNYNVFILQGQGKRLWEIQEDPKVSWRSDEEIKVLREFTPDYVWELNPGDMVYIPPGVAHHGISVEESISYSIGFKSLETIDLFGEYLANLKESGTSSSFFKNPCFNRFSKSDAGQELLPFLREEAVRGLSSKEFKVWLAKRLSAPKFPIRPSGQETPRSFQGLAMQRDAYLKYVVFDLEDSLLVGINGSAKELSKEEFQLLAPVLDSNPFDTFTIDAKQEKTLLPLLVELFESGCVFEPEEEDED